MLRVIPTVALPLSLTAALLTSSCVVAVDGGGWGWDTEKGLVQDGVRLDAEHEEELVIDGWHAEGLRVQSHSGDIHVRTTDGPDRIVATVHEHEAGDGQVRYQGGRLFVESASGKPVALGDVTVHAGGPIIALRLETGMGDVTVDSVDVRESLVATTGMGDVSVEGVHPSGGIQATTGMGDVDVDDSTCENLTASTGMGDVQVASVQAHAGTLSSGMGDVEAAHSSFEELQATTGLGDVDCRGTRYRSGRIETGLGSVDHD